MMESKPIINQAKKFLLKPSSIKSPSTNSKGTLNTPEINTNTNTVLLNKCVVAWIFCHKLRLDFHTVGNIFFAVSAPPFIQRNCWDFKLLISAGSSAGEPISSIKRIRQPLSCARMLRSKSSVSVSASQPPASSIAGLAAW